MLLAKASLKTGPGSGLVIHITLVYPGQSFKYQVFILASFVQSADLSIYFGFFFLLHFLTYFLFRLLISFLQKPIMYLLDIICHSCPPSSLQSFFFYYYCI